MGKGVSIWRWLPSLLIMVAIFSLSSLPAARIPFFGDYDFLVKKGSHALGYAMLGVAYFIALPPRLSTGYRWLLALIMAALFALSDEFHQSFVEGRTSTLRDVLIDTGGAAVALTVTGIFYSSNSSSKSST